MRVREGRCDKNTPHQNYGCEKVVRSGIRWGQVGHYMAK